MANSIRILQHLHDEMAIAENQDRMSHRIMNFSANCDCLHIVLQSHQNNQPATYTTVVSYLLRTIMYGNKY